MKAVKNKSVFLLAAGGVLLFGLVAFVLLTSTATTKAVVLNDSAAAGTTITDSMVKEIDVPKDTPGDFYKTKSSIVGERLTNNMKKDQLIYPSNLMSSIDVNAETNENFVTTTIKVKDDNALGGLLTAGDTVDIGVVPSDGDSQSLAKQMSEFGIDTSTNGGFYFVLANVRLVDTTTAVSAAQGTAASSVNGEESTNTSSSTGGYSYYVVSVSYNDYKKLRLAEQYGDLFLNLVPKQNKENDPMLEEMSKPVYGGLTDASKEYEVATTTETKKNEE